MSAIDSDRFVLVDECSTNTSLAPLYGRDRNGERAHQKTPRNWGKNMTLLSSIGKEGGVRASLVVEGSTNRAVFEPYLGDILCPTLKKGQVVVMDNLSSHKGERVRKLIEGKNTIPGPFKTTSLMRPRAALDVVSEAYVLCRSEDDSSLAPIPEHEDVADGVAAGRHRTEVEDFGYGLYAVERRTKTGTGA